MSNSSEVDGGRKRRIELGEEDTEIDELFNYGVGRNGCIALHYYVHFLRIFHMISYHIISDDDHFSTITV